jgi:hypothetical protein
MDDADWATDTPIGDRPLPQSAIQKCSNHPIRNHPMNHPIRNRQSAMDGER